MIALYIFLAVEAVILTAWITYAMNTELELYCWINKKRVFRGYFDTLADLNDYVYKLEAIHGDCLTDWIIKPVHKKKFVKQISGMDETILKLAIHREEKLEDMKNQMKYMDSVLVKNKKLIDSNKVIIDRTKATLNEN